MEATGSSTDSYGIISSDSNVTINDGDVTASGEKQAVKGIVKNAKPGYGWSNTEGTEGETAIAINEDPGAKLSYKKVHFLPGPVEAVKNLIRSIPDDPTTAEGRATVIAAREAYDKLTDDQKDEIKGFQDVCFLAGVLFAGIDGKCAVGWGICVFTIYGSHS